MQGGKFLGRGSAGCVQSPGLVCTRRTDISKILFREKDAREEFLASKRALELDPNHIQTVVPSEICQKKWSDVAQEEGSSQCALHFRPKLETPIWVLQSEGIYHDVDDAFRQKLTNASAFRISYGILNCMQGVQYLHANMLLHNDIHITNTVDRPLPHEGPNPMKMIDFGQSMDLRAFVVDYKAAVLKYAYLEEQFLKRQTQKRFTAIQAMQWQTFFHLDELRALDREQVPLWVSRARQKQPMSFRLIKGLRTLRQDSRWTEAAYTDRCLIENVLAVWTLLQTSDGIPEAIIASMTLHDNISVWTLLDRVVYHMSKTFSKSKTQKAAFVVFQKAIEKVSVSLQQKFLSFEVQTNPIQLGPSIEKVYQAFQQLKH